GPAAEQADPLVEHRPTTGHGRAGALAGAVPQVADTERGVDLDTPAVPGGTDVLAEHGTTRCQAGELHPAVQGERGRRGPQGRPVRVLEFPGGAVEAERAVAPLVADVGRVETGRAGAADLLAGCARRLRGLEVEMAAQAVMQQRERPGASFLDQRQRHQTACIW